MSEDKVIRAWVSQEIENKALEVSSVAKTDHDSLEVIVKNNHESLQKFMKQKFEFLQAKQFTIPKLVG